MSWSLFHMLCVTCIGQQVKEEQEMWKAREVELAADRDADMRKHSPIVRCVYYAHEW